MAETDARLSKKIDDLRTFINNDIGTTAQANEEFFFRSLERSLRLGNVQYDSIGRNLRLNNHSPEFDIVLINGDSVCIVEVKKNANIKEVDALIEKTISNFKEHCTKYADYKIYFALASVNIYPDLVTKSAEKGIFLLTEQNEVMEILNDKAAAY